MKWFYSVLFFAILNQAFAQIDDDFSDGNFSQNPSWNGDVDKFVVDSNKRLQLNAPAQNDNAYLITPCNVIQNATWEFKVILGFNPSSANQLKVYLSSDQGNLKNSLNGYYVLIGGTSDELSLFKQIGHSSSKLIDGRDKVLDKDSNCVSVKVLVDQQGNWQLLSDTGKTGNFILEGTANDRSILSSNYFGIRCEYSQTRAKRFWLDDFKVRGTAEQINPFVKAAYPIGLSQIAIKFSEAMLDQEAQNTNNYLLQPDGIKPSNVILLNADSVLLEFAAPFANGSTHTLQISNLIDLSQNRMDDTSLAIQFFEAEQVLRGDVFISEIYPDPSPSLGLPDAEYIEIHNASNKVLDLADLSLLNGSVKHQLPSRILYPNEYLTICSVNDTAKFSSIANVVGLSSWSALNNDADSLGLCDSRNLALDEVNYSRNWYRDANKDDGGYALEKIHPSHPCNNDNNWKAANALIGGTPGAQNSIYSIQEELDSLRLIKLEVINDSSLILQFKYYVNVFEASQVMVNAITAIEIFKLDSCENCYLLNLGQALREGNNLVEFTGVQNCFASQLQPSDYVVYVSPSAKPNEVIVNEIMADPNPVVDLPNAEYIELYNNSDKDFQLMNWSLKNGSQTRLLDNYLLLPNSYLIICRSEDSALFNTYGPVMYLSNWVSLGNAGDSLALYNQNGLLINEFIYTDKYYGNNDKKDGGWSLELINPKNTCLGQANIRASEDSKGGTPGQVNSLFLNTPNDNKLRWLNVNVESASKITIVFNHNLMASDSVQLHFLSAEALEYQLTTNKNTLHIKLSAAIDSGAFYRFYLSGLSNCIGSTVDTNQVVELALGYTAKKGDAVFNELMIDPSPSQELPDLEYMELYNRSNKLISLQNCSINGKVIKGKVLLLPNSYLLLCDSAKLSLISHYPNVCSVSNLGSTFLSNTGKHIYLNNAQGEEVSALNYELFWYNNPDKEEGGFSLELINPEIKCINDANYWRACENQNGGTPGQTNSVFQADYILPELTYKASYFLNDTLSIAFNQALGPMGIWKCTPEGLEQLPTNSRNLVRFLFKGDKNTSFLLSNDSISACNSQKIIALAIPFEYPDLANKNLVINELHYDPKGDETDFIEIYNRGEKPIALNGIYISQDENEAIDANKLLDSLGRLLPAKSYLVITKDSSSLYRQFPNARKENTLVYSATPNFPNEAGAVLLGLDTQGAIDLLNYSDKMHLNQLSFTEGISLERISPFAPSALFDNWTSAAEHIGGATPGYQNSQYLNTAAHVQFALNPETISPNNDGHHDAMSINFTLNETDWIGTVSIYDLEGREVKKLSDKTNFATHNNSYLWKGDDSNGNIVNPGVYIVLVALENQKGEQKRLKKPGVVGY